ncbi:MULTISPECIES: hypothetical protein [unclassified Modicisalibacter]|uniref:hypothetical protein n=1 Tax=unclassified Modicisalibacter TaxID=2679913 RepID=UPI001CC9CBF2|nr:MULTISPECIES: hypothetical protein [unclassified Modicisalibacter]MBZ9559388.1 hypothetical protein [Modicisalibacter sp. R2A 31.J]MBZ9576447.1 hypothetical protein [Modicisalibacter sp. MOD 31.J]
MPRFVLLAFVAGFLAVLCFHQPAVGLLHAYGVIPFAPYATAPVAPLGVPQWFSASFWGGVWGVVMLGLFARLGVDRGLWWKSGLFGGVVLTLVALLVVFPLKGRGFNPAVFPIGFVVNGAWGLGMWVFTRCFIARQGAPHP